MHELLQLIQQHPMIAGAVALWLASSAVQALPEPKPDSSGLYVWFYRFTHIAGANWKQVVASKLPK